MRRGTAWGLLLIFWGAWAWTANVSSLMDQGKAQFERGDYRRALQTFVKVKKDDPANQVAREYISKCMAKITESEKAEKEKRAILSEESSSATIGPKEVAPSWAVSPPRAKASGANHGMGSKKRVGHPAPLVPAAVLEKEKKTSRFIVKRDELTGVYTNKILDGRAIDLIRKGNRLEVVAFMNRLFLPFSDSFVPDAIPAMETISREIRNHSDQVILFRAVDSLTPAVRAKMLDLPTRRVSILFSTLLHGALVGQSQEARGSFTAADLDD